MGHVFKNINKRNNSTIDDTSLLKLVCLTLLWMYIIVSVLLRFYYLNIYSS